MKAGRICEIAEEAGESESWKLTEVEVIVAAIKQALHEERNEIADWLENDTGSFGTLEGLAKQLRGVE